MWCFFYNKTLTNVLIRTSCLSIWVCSLTTGVKKWATISLCYMYVVKELIPAYAFVKGFRDLTLVHWLTVGSLDFLRLWVRCCSCSTASLGTFGICYKKKDITQNSNIERKGKRLQIAFDSTSDAAHKHVGCKHIYSNTTLLTLVWRWCDWPCPGEWPFPLPWPVVWWCERETWWESLDRATAEWCSRPEEARLGRWSWMMGGLGRWICGEDSFLFTSSTVSLSILDPYWNSNTKHQQVLMLRQRFIEWTTHSYPIIKLF